MSSFGFTKLFSEKWRKVPDEVLGGYCRGTDIGSEYLQGTAEGMEVVMCD
jgi:hypothetical protein